MAKVFVFCIGGTGLRVMKSVVMMAAAGMRTSGYDIVPVIIDPHVDLEENTILTTTIGDYIKVYKNATTDRAQQLSAPSGFLHPRMRCFHRASSGAPFLSIRSNLARYTIHCIRSCHRSLYSR